MEPGDGKVTLVATLMGCQWVDRYSDQCPLTSHAVKKSFICRPDACEPAILDRDAFFGARITHHRYLQCGGGATRVRGMSMEALWFLIKIEC